ncbi:hypothetical protein FA13DRAFT_1622091 [Coprinellus micaceus]|uniref:Uncharacterized protein n=1 Tax=Coprinellus micaceus TaxID=71717 RepID=A0A4Y7TTN9_COPMI|nr:hypothetical protein FA13DRAFT_1622091 [Coprinellus micaceus]
MSGPSYRMQSSRTRPIPPPLEFDESTSYKSTTVLNQRNQDSETLLYDLPSPPTSPRSVSGRILSPTSPSFRSQSRNGRPTPPPSARMRSTTPIGFAPSELERFAEYCRAWYFHQDDKAGTLMTQTLATLPPSQKASFSRVQASIRSAYHRSVNARRHAEFQAHLAATQPGASLPAHARSDPRGPFAQKERHERFKKFLSNWCTSGLPGTKPFFEALWAIMRLQVIPEELGGAGRNRIEWEFDDAVFKEAAGKDFMLEAIDVLKGVLAFEEVSSSKIPSPYSHKKDSSLSSTIHARSQSQPISQIPPPASRTQTTRARAPSDPFVDASPSLTRPFASSSAAGFDSEPPSPFTGFGEEYASRLGGGGDQGIDDGDEAEYMRTWTSPDLANPEILELLKLFPAFVSRRTLPRFPTPQPGRAADIEEGEDDNMEGKQIRFGTGSMWISVRQRSDGWEGNWWVRFVLWWKRVFSC